MPRLFSLLIATSLLLVSCAGTASEVQVIQITATRQPPTATAEPAATATEKPLSGPRATAAALAGQVTLNAPTPLPGLEDVGYVGAVDSACAIVEENYVRGDFNGVDWEATCEEYRQRAASIETDEAMHALLDDLIAELDDQHSRYVSPDDFAAEFRLSSGTAGRPWTGLNTWPAREWEYLYLWDVCDSGPAAQAGLSRGDIVTHVNGQPVTAEDGIERDLWIEAMFGEEGQEQVDLTVLKGPEQEESQVSLRLGGASGCDGWQASLVTEEPRIGYIRIPNFAGDSESNIMQAIDNLEEGAPLDGLILDVRHNPGGNSDAALGIFTEGQFGRIGKLREDSTLTNWIIRGPAEWNETTPVAVLTDGASASAAEYFATGMQQSDRATLVGMPTAGNTEGITGFNVPGGGVIRLAVQTLILPDGSTFEDVGVQPDVRQPLGMWGLHQRPDIQLQTAYEVLTDQSLSISQ